MSRRLHSIVLAVALAATACSTVYEFDPVDVGGDGADRAPRARSNGQYLRLLYADLLGRAPEVYDFVVTGPGGDELLRFPVDEQQYLTNSLDGVGDPAPLRSLIADGLVHSQEVDLPDKADVDDPAAFIRDEFRHYLGRDPNTYELAAFVGEWDSDPAVGPAAVVRSLVGSREYQSY